MKHFILMADIINSSKKDAVELIDSFKMLVVNINQKHKDLILSPLTITLGDEFQGVIKDLKGALKVIIELEEERIHVGLGFKLRFVLCYGDIATPINHETANGMLGEGLADARTRLDELKKKADHRFDFILEDKVANRLMDIFFLYQYLIDSWNAKDLEVVSAFFQLEDYKKVAKLLKKDPSTAWRRERNLGIRQYNACKRLITAYA